MADFNLRDLVREVCDSSTATDPASLVKEVNRRIKKEDRDLALEQALPCFVVQHISRTRYSPGGHGGNDTHDDLAAGGSSTTRPAKASSTPTVSSAGYVSRKVEAIANAHHAMLQKRFTVGPHRSKFLADCTVDDLRYAAALRREQEARNAFRASQIETLIEAMLEHGAATVGELPPSVVSSIWKAAA